VLIVDDEPGVVDAYALQLREEYDVRRAYGGEEALDEIDEDVDAVLLDRRMPDIHGDEVLKRIHERGYDCKIIMTTAVDPDLDILSLDFDDYLCKPILRETLLETLDQQLDTPSTDQRLDEFFQAVSKVEVLEEELPPGQLSDHEEYQRLKERSERLGNELAEELSDFQEIIETFREINRSTD